ncbi:MAG: hypothetical protein WC864_11005 [Ilumatobacteraceae bacterium]
MPTSQSNRRQQPGEVRDAIIAVLRDAGRPMEVEEIHAAVTNRLRAKVPASSIRSYLGLNCGQGKHFERVGRGAYKLSR